MFGGASRVMSEMAGTSDNCTCIFDSNRIRAESQYVGLFVPHDEIPFMLLKCIKGEYIFTDKAFITVFGDAAVGKKRFVGRYDFYDNYISEVGFETSGIGATDLDCELKFLIGGNAVSIDIKKAEADAAAMVYRVLIAVSRAQVINAQKYKLAESALLRNTFTEAKQGNLPRTVHDDMTAIDGIYERYRPASYIEVFRSTGLN